MGGIFNIDGKAYQILEKIANCIIVSVFWLFFLFRFSPLVLLLQHCIIQFTESFAKIQENSGKPSGPHSRQTLDKLPFFGLFFYSY